MQTLERVTQRQYPRIRKQRHRARHCALLTKKNPSRAMSSFLDSSTIQNESVLTVMCIIFLIIAADLCPHIHFKSPVVLRPQFNFDAHMATLSSQLFRRMYRLSKEQFNILSKLLSVTLLRMQRKRSYIAASVSVPVILCLTLRLLAGESYLDLGWAYGVAESAVYHVFHETLHVLNEVLPQIRFPISFEEFFASADLLEKRCQSPLDGVVAALDSIAIEIIRPKLREASDSRKYYNRKGVFAIFVQAAVQAYYKFCFVLARYAGGKHDSTALKATLLYDLLSGPDLPSWAAFVADEAYTNKHRILTPYLGRNLSIKEDSFNAYHSLSRVCCEQAFGMLVCRFGIFWSALRYSLPTSTLIIMVTCKLHNFIIDYGDSSLFELVPHHDDNRVTGTPIIHFQDDCHTEGENRRSRNRRRETSSWRYELAEKLHRLGYLPRRRFI